MVLSYVKNCSGIEPYAAYLDAWSDVMSCTSDVESEAFVKANYERSQAEISLKIELAKAEMARGKSEGDTDWHSVGVYTG